MKGPFWTRGPSFAREAVVAPRAGSSVRARVSLSPGRAGLPRRADFAADALQASSALFALRAGGTAKADFTLRTRSARLTGFAVGTRTAGRTGFATDPPLAVGAGHAWRSRLTP